MSMHLDQTEARVLGCLVEKELATPEYYPLTLNALVNACTSASSSVMTGSRFDFWLQALARALRVSG